MTTDYDPFDEYDDIDSDPYFDAYDAGFDAGFEDYEPSPYDGTYSED